MNVRIKAGKDIFKANKNYRTPFQNSLCFFDRQRENVQVKNNFPTDFRSSLLVIARRLQWEGLSSNLNPAMGSFCFLTRHLSSK